MKNKSLFVIVKASLKSNKALSAMFCFFVVVSFVLVFLAVEIVVPLGVNIETKLHQHILNREILIEISDVVSEEEHQRRLEEIRGIPHVTDIYTNPYSMFVSDESGILKNEYEISFVHKYYSPEIISGRIFDETEKSVAIVPAKFQDFDYEKGMMKEVDGASLVGKILKLKDMTDTVREFEVVGAYDTTDPIFNGKEILIPIAQLSECKQNLDEAFPDRYQKVSAYIVVTDSPDNTEEVYEKVEKITNSYRRNLSVDVETYSIAFVILLAVSVLFVLLTIFGFYMFLKGNINARTNELALYRAIGYKSKDLYRIVLGEHLLLTAASIVLGVVCYYTLAYSLVNPYLYSFLGDTYMEMSVSTNPLYALAIAAGYVLITLLVSIAAVYRTEKIDLTVLLKE